MTISVKFACVVTANGSADQRCCRREPHEHTRLTAVDLDESGIRRPSTSAQCRTQAEQTCGLTTIPLRTPFTNGTVHVRSVSMTIFIQHSFPYHRHLTLICSRQKTSFRFGPRARTRKCLGCKSGALQMLSYIHTHIHTSAAINFSKWHLVHDTIYLLALKS